MVGLTELNKPHTLWQVYPRWLGCLQLVLLLANVGLQAFSHVGLSAVVKSNVPAGDTGATGSEDGSCDQDALFRAWFIGEGQCTFPEVVNACIFETNTEACFGQNGFQGGSACAECLYNFGSCIRSRCALTCACQLTENPTAQCITNCANCVSNNCILPLENCIGFDTDEFADSVDCSEITPGSFTGGSNFTGSGASEQEEFGIDPIHVVYEISFISSVRDAIDGETYGIAIVVLLFSGIWPYLKNVIMFVAYFVPMTARTRSVVLRNLTRFAKWSLVDVFAIVIIVAGVDIDKSLPNGSRIIVVAEARIAIVTFCIAAIWDLLQGEYMRWKQLQLLEANQKMEDEKRDSKIIQQALSDAVRFQDRRFSLPGKLSFGFMMLIQIGFAFTAVAAICISFAITGLVSSLGGPNLREFSQGSLASYLFSEEAVDHAKHPAQQSFLALVYILMAGVIPLMEYVGILIVTFVPLSRIGIGTRGFQTFCNWIDIGGGFASLDVFVLAFGTVIAEWGRFIDKAIGTQAEGLCGLSNCLGMDAELEVGFYFAVVAAIMGWILELFFTFSFSQIYHPVEQVAAAEFVFLNAAKGGLCCNRVGPETIPDDAGESNNRSEGLEKAMEIS